MSEGFLKRFLKTRGDYSKVTKDELQSRGSKDADPELDIGDTTNPAVFQQYLGTATAAELKEALAYAEKMELGDIAEKIRDRMREMDTAALGVVKGQLEGKMGQVGPLKDVASFLQPGYIKRRGGKTKKRKTSKRKTAKRLQKKRK